MRHRKSGIKLNRTTSHRQAMFRNMVTSLFKYDRIKTTDAKAKELRRWADQMITLAKRGDLHARRQALSIIREKQIVHKLFEEATDRFGKRSGGYTRITKLGLRSGDAASISLIELISSSESAEKKKKKKAAEKPAPSTAKPEVEQEEPVEAAEEAVAVDDDAAKVDEKDEAAEAVEAKEEGSETGDGDEKDEPKAEDSADEAKAPEEDKKTD